MPKNQESVFDPLISPLISRLTVFYNYQYLDWWFFIQSQRNRQSIFSVFLSSYYVIIVEEVPFQILGLFKSTNF